MSAEDSETHGSNHSEDIKRWLTIGNSVILVLVLFAMTVSTILIFSLRNDVSALEEQTRKSAKTSKALQEELSALKEKLHLASSPLAAQKGSGAGQATNIDAATPGLDCVVRPGDKNSLSNCMKFGPGGQ